MKSFYIQFSLGKKKIGQPSKGYLNSYVFITFIVFITFFIAFTAFKYVFVSLFLLDFGIDSGKSLQRGVTFSSNYIVSSFISL